MNFSGFDSADAAKFWTRQNIKILRGVTARAIENLRISEEDFFKRYLDSSGHIAEGRAARRFTHKSKPTERLRPAGKMSVLLHGLQRASEHITDHDIIHQVADLMRAHASAVRTLAHNRPAAPTLENAGAIVEVLGQELSMSSVDFAKVGSTFFPTSHTRKDKPRNFICYRFHSEPGRIVKTFLSIYPPNDRSPACSFVSFDRDPGSPLPRESKGIVIPMRDAIYFIGRLDKHVGLEVRVLDRPPPDRLCDRFAGLLLTLDTRSVAARFIMVATAENDYLNASIGVFPLGTIRDELVHQKIELDQLRNKIPFVLENKLLLGSNVVNQKQLVVEVLDRLSDNGVPIFTFENGQAFNPADHEQYTFNSALTIGKLE